MAAPGTHRCQELLNDVSDIQSAFGAALAPLRAAMHNLESTAPTALVDAAFTSRNSLTQIGQSIGRTVVVKFRENSCGISLRFCEAAALVDFAARNNTDILNIGIATNHAQGTIWNLNTLNNDIFDLSPLRALSEMTGLITSIPEMRRLPSMTLFPSLQRLRLQKCGLEGFDELAHHPSLTELTIVAKTPSIIDLRSLATLSRLQELTLVGFTVAHFGAIASLTSLRHFNCRDAGIDDLTPIARLDNLQTLQLAKNRIVSLEPLRNLKGLTIVALDDNPISDFSPIFDLQNLQEITCNAELPQSQINEMLRRNIPYNKLLPVY